VPTDVKVPNAMAPILMKNKGVKSSIDPAIDTEFPVVLAILQLYITFWSSSRVYLKMLKVSSLQLLTLSKSSSILQIFGARSS
jgi:hypothetical protein